jgi:hypothetical protein
MAKDGIHIRFNGGLKLDRALTEIGNLKQSKATLIVNSSLSAAATQLKSSIKSVTPKSKTNSSGRDGSRGAETKVKGHTKGTLRRSLTTRLQKTSSLSKDRSVFAASVYVADGHGKNPEKDANKDGWYAHFLQGGTPNIAKNDFMAKGAKLAVNKVTNKLGSTLAKKIAAFGQMEINKLG